MSPLAITDPYGGRFPDPTPEELAQWNARRAKERRLFELEQALKREPCKAYRRELVVEYLRLTDPEPQELNL